ncbi:hypothetical protein NQ317_011679 [Molorchus minor]|uniref:Uncharacterized protein n=1 Tax=Molorchus minor TaxID=1323400 RepID=A0ABQ9ISA4_9CUCU|nr:hypothetical protein NQ317_011679 [Molorchus minor]
MDMDVLLSSSSSEDDEIDNVIFHIQQSSFYGYTSMLPPKYTQAVMVGESTSGVFTSMVRVLTRFLVKELRGSTIYFFTVSVSSVATCFAMYHLIRRTDFIQFYIALCERAKTRITLEPTEDAGLNSPPPTGNNLSFPTQLRNHLLLFPLIKLKTLLLEEDQALSQSTKSASKKRGTNKDCFRSAGQAVQVLDRGMQARWEVTKAIYPLYDINMSGVFRNTLPLPGHSFRGGELSPWTVDAHSDDGHL